MPKPIQLKPFATKFAQSITSAPRLITVGAVTLLILGAVAAYAATAGHSQHARVTRVLPAPSASPTPKPTATPTPTASTAPTSKPVAPVKPMPAASTTSVLTSVPKIDPITTTSTPSPTASPIVITPEVAAWYTSWGKNELDSIFFNFSLLGQAADAGDMATIASDCWALGQNAQTGLLTPAIPNQALDQQYRTGLSQLVQGSTQCNQGITAADATVATDGLTLMGTGGVSLAQLQATLTTPN